MSSLLSDPQFSMCKMRASYSILIRSCQSDKAKIGDLPRSGQMGLGPEQLQWQLDHGRGEVPCVTQGEEMLPNHLHTR